MNLRRKLSGYVRVFRRARFRGPTDLIRVLARRPGIALGVTAYEAGLLASSRVDPRLVALAQVKTSALVGCPY